MSLVRLCMILAQEFRGGNGYLALTVAQLGITREFQGWFFFSFMNTLCFHLDSTIHLFADVDGSKVQGASGHGGSVSSLANSIYYLPFIFDQRLILFQAFLN